MAIECSGPTTFLTVTLVGVVHLVYVFGTAGLDNPPADLTTRSSLRCT
ncbi:MAG: hypothetical protein ABR498_03020 [Candidatus Dormibacteria bacterium]